MSSNTYNDDDLLPIGEAARVLGVSVSTVRRWESLGHIAALRTLGNQRRYRFADIASLLGRAA